jgi:cytochrome c oxidase subunit II
VPIDCCGWVRIPIYGCAEEVGLMVNADFFRSPRNLRAIAAIVFATVVLVLISLWMGQLSYGWFPPQASAEAVLVDRLFSFLVALGTFVFLGVVGTLSFSILFQQAGRYEAGDGPPIEGNVPLEIVWTAIPFAMVIWIALYSYQVYDQMAIEGPMEHSHGMRSGGAGLQMASGPIAATGLAPIEVRSRQWSWEFFYPEAGVTSAELHVPMNQRVQVALSSADVLHGFYVPAFRIKQDIVPGEVRVLSFTPIREGSYRLRDSQYSGTYFAAMQTNVVVESPEAYAQWLAMAASQAPTPAYNQAFEEYQVRGAGWQTVVPAAPPLVNDPTLAETPPEAPAVPTAPDDLVAAQSQTQAQAQSQTQSQTQSEEVQTP